MAKAPHLIPQVESLIADIYIENRELGPTAIHEKLLLKMKEEGLDRIFGPNWPGVSSVGKKIREIRDKEIRLSLGREDKPWSLVALADYDILPETLPLVMSAWSKALEDDKPLTIRQVKWIARLYYFSKNKGIDFLIERALEYASREKAIKLTGTYPDKPGDAWWLWFSDAITYLQATGDDSPLRKCMKSMKWQTTTDIAELKAKLNIKEGNDYERLHS